MSGPNSTDVRIHSRALDANTKAVAEFNKNIPKVIKALEAQNKVLEALNNNIVAIGRVVAGESDRPLPVAIVSEEKPKTSPDT